MVTLLICYNCNKEVVGCAIPLGTSHSEIQKYCHWSCDCKFEDCPQEYDVDVQDTRPFYMPCIKCGLAIDKY